MTGPMLLELRPRTFTSGSVWQHSANFQSAASRAFQGLVRDTPTRRLRREEIENDLSPDQIYNADETGLW